MKLIILFLLIFSATSQACIIDPFKMTTMHSEDIRKKSDVVFFGKLVEVVMKDNGSQEAKFIVIKSYKGNAIGNITIENKELTSCFRHFKTIGSAYYVFALKTNKPNTFKIPTSATFVPLEAAIEYKWDIH